MPLGRLLRTKFVRRLITTPEQRAAEDARRALLTGQQKKTAGHARARHRKLGAHLGIPGMSKLRKAVRASEGHNMLGQPEQKQPAPDLKFVPAANKKSQTHRAEAQQQKRKKAA